MLRWSLLLIGVGVAAGSLPVVNENILNDLLREGPVRPGVFLGSDGEPVVIEAGDVGLYPTGMFDDLIDYENDIKFLLYTTDNPTTEQQLYLDNTTSITQSNFNASRLTKFVIHGFMNTVKSGMVVKTTDAFLNNGDFNIIVVDWSTLADDILYPVVVSQVPAVGKYVGKFIQFLVNNASVSPSHVHLVGHSLGAHVAGFAGKEAKSVGSEISRISGLDPALPGYAFDSSSTRLAKTDAEYVDCIHTCGGLKGFLSPICQSDFYPNGGINPQPGCSLFDFGTCSHAKAYRYFAASINETNVFNSKRCWFVLLGIPLDCSDKRTALMGYPAGTEKSQGIYYLKTTRNYPYAEST